MHPGYEYADIDFAAPGAARNLDNRCVVDVRAAFDRLSTRGDPLAVRADDAVFPKHRYTRIGQGRNRGFIHFQGIQRLRQGRYGIVTGGDRLQPAAHVFVMELGSRYVRGPWGSNLVRSNEPPEEDRVAGVVAIGREHWHAGGTGLLGDVAAIPLERDDRHLSRTVFIDFSDPLQPRPLPIEVEGRSVKAGAAALTRLPDGRFVCLIWREEKVKGKKPPGWMDFHLSHTDDICDGFGEAPFATVYYGEVGNRGDRRPSYQTVQFLVHGDAADPSGWKYYLAGTWNGSDAAPTVPGPDWGDLHEIEFDPRLLAGESPGDPAPPRLNLVAARRFTCFDCFGNFDAAAGFHVDELGRLSLLSAFHWRYDDAIIFAEFREETPADAPPVTAVQDAWIELYEHSRFAGRRLSIIGTRDENLPDYDRIAAQCATFNDMVSSARWQIPRGYTYRLYANADYDESAGFIDLKGDGHVQQIENFKDLRPSFNDRVSSSRYV